MPPSFGERTVMHQGVHDEEKTLMRTGVSELRSDEYEAVPSWQTNERTVHVGDVAVPKAALPSDYPPALGGMAGERTMIMQGSPVQPGAAAPPPPSAGAPPATQPLPPRAPFGSGYSNTPQAFAVQQMPVGSDPNVPPVSGSPNDMMFVAGPARPPPGDQEGGGSRVLVFIAVALVSMVIVIVTGLIILAASD
jgi:hypothetical protein